MGEFTKLLIVISKRQSAERSVHFSVLSKFSYTSTSDFHNGLESTTARAPACLLATEETEENIRQMG